MQTWMNDWTNGEVLALVEQLIADLVEEMPHDDERTIARNTGNAACSELARRLARLNIPGNEERPVSRSAS